MPLPPLTGKRGEKLGIKNPWTGKQETRTTGSLPKIKVKPDGGPAIKKGPLAPGGVRG
jgi:hypothetical protein